ncbi:MAG: conjugal transfer protein TraX [Oscillospiraceae bacterium]|nr:conjugal transfer protein TraX [Oscillospiraceae bacterium]
MPIKRGLDSFQLKIVALFLMTIDHLAAYRVLPVSGDVNALMRIFGRIAAPLFLFLLARGLRHTKSKIKYTLRLYVAGAALQAANEIAGAYFLEQGTILQIGNIFQTLFYAALYITCIDMMAKRKEKKGNAAKSSALMAASLLLVFAHMYLPDFSAFFSIFLPSPFLVEYSFLFVLLGVAWYMANDKIISCAALFVFSLVSLAIDHRVFSNPYGFTFAHMFYPTQWFMMLALPFMALHNGERGKIRLKYLFYAYYPLHQYLFFFIAYLANR